MDIYFTYSDVTQHPLYDCSNITAEYHKIYEVEHSLHGYISITWGLISLILYFLCLFAMCSKEHARYSCYKIMIYLAFVDTGGIIISSLAYGYLLMEGASFCTHPNLIYNIGAVGMFFWLSESLTCLLLVSNRIMEVTFPELAKMLFQGWRTGLMIFIGPFLYGLFGMMHGPPPLFNSFLQAFFFDPFIHQGRILEYANYIHFYNNIVVCSLTCLCYGLFCANFQRKFRHYFKDKKSKKNAHVFIQASIICCVNLIAAIIYVVMQNFTLPPIFVHIAQLSFQLVHSCPPYIYITFNKAVRHKILSFFGVQMARTGQATSGVYVNNKIGASSMNAFPANYPSSGNQAESIII